jgi:hypothetical protein
MSTFLSKAEQRLIEQGAHLSECGDTVVGPRRARGQEPRSTSDRAEIRASAGADIVGALAQLLAERSPDTKVYVFNGGRPAPEDLRSMLFRPKGGKIHTELRAGRVIYRNVLTAINVSPEEGKWLTAVYDGVRDGLTWLTVFAPKQNAVTGDSFALPKAPALITIGDDRDTAKGPGAFDQHSLREAIRAAGAITIVVCEGLPAVYANAVSGAFKYGHAVLIETQPDQEEAWFKFVREHLSPEAEINAALVKGRARGPEAAAFSAAARAPEIRTPRRTNPGRS